MRIPPSMKELFRFTQSDNGEWTTSPDQNRNDPPGFEVQAPGRAGHRTRREGWTTKDVWAPVQVGVKFEKDQVEDGKAPGNLKPLDVVLALFGKESKIEVEPGVLDKVIDVAAKKIREKYAGSGFDYVVPMPSSKGVTDKLAQKIAGTPDKILRGLVKQTDPNKIELDPNAAAKNPKLVKDLERAKRDVGAGKPFSIRQYFAAQNRQYVSGYHDVNVDALQAALERAKPKVLLVDDFVTTGNSVADAVKKLQEYGFVVVGTAAIFLQKQPSQKKEN